MLSRRCATLAARRCFALASHARSLRHKTTSSDTALVLGGAGLVGVQVCRRIAEQFEPSRVIVGALEQDKAEAAAQVLSGYADMMSLRTEFVPMWGNLFMPADLAHLPKAEVFESPEHRARLLRWLYDDFDKAYADSAFAQAIVAHEPRMIVDSVNTATGLAYLNVFDGVEKMRDWTAQGPSGLASDQAVGELEQLMLSQAMPQLIRHVRVLQRALTDTPSVASYVKVGTTGTGGLGLQIPYTHDEEAPSPLLLAKNATAFAHTGLLMLLARTPGVPSVKEIKPAAMIGYRSIDVAEAKDKNGNSTVFAPHRISIGPGTELSLNTSQAPQSGVGDADAWQPVGQLRLPLLDAGENGSFTLGEFEAISAVNAMEMVTPEEIADVVVAELAGKGTGHDVITAIDGSLMGPSFRSGVLRRRAIAALRNAESTQPDTLPSIALGKLGPPSLSKLLFEGSLIKARFPTLEAAIQASPDEISDVLSAAAHGDTQDDTDIDTLVAYATSIGIPVLLGDGESLLRGPRLNIPQIHGHVVTATVEDAGDIDAWAERGWVDLRPANIALWQTRLAAVARISREMEARDPNDVFAGSACLARGAYLAEGFEVGEVVAWVLGTEEGGSRIK